MNVRISLAALGLAACAWPALAQDPVQLLFSDSTTADVPRSRALTERFGPALGEEFDLRAHFGATLMNQGTELTALQRGNLQLALLPPSDLAEQVPAFNILGAAYVVRDADHMSRIFDSEVGDHFRDLAREEIGVEIIGAAYYGTRHLNLKGDDRIETPEDLDGVTLRMPDGESWQFLGRAIGASPVPMAYSEVYTALQTGVIDGQDNPLPNDYAMKFYEVTDQIALTGHNVGFGLLLVDADLFASFTPEQQERMRVAADEAFAWSDAEYQREEEELIEFFENEGLEVYTPDVEAFRAHAQEMYLDSPLSDSWPEGMLDKINAL